MGIDMRPARMTVALALTGGLVVVGAGAASAAPTKPPNPNAVENCQANILKQNERGVSPGGGPKTDEPAPEPVPTNCDLYYGGGGQGGVGQQ